MDDVSRGAGAFLTTDIAHEFVGGFLVIKAVASMILCFYLTRAERKARDSWSPWPPSFGWKLAVSIGSESFLFLILGFIIMFDRRPIELWVAFLSFVVMATALALLRAFAEGE